MKSRWSWNMFHPSGKLTIITRRPIITKFCVIIKTASMHCLHVGTINTTNSDGSCESVHILDTEGLALERNWIVFYQCANISKVVFCNHLSTPTTRSIACAVFLQFWNLRKQIFGLNVAYQGGDWEGCSVFCFVFHFCWDGLGVPGWWWKIGSGTGVIFMSWSFPLAAFVCFCLYLP